MKRLVLPGALLLLCAGCATNSASGGGGLGAVAFDDCYEDYCVGRLETGQRYLYVRTPGTPIVAQRGSVHPSDRGDTSTHTVDRSSTQISSMLSSAARGSVASASSGQSTTTVQRP
jgi:hypothetical protein